MSEKSVEKSKARAQAVLAAIASIIEEGGVGAVNAREVATRAGIAVGGIYLAFGTLDAAILAANAATLGRLDAAMEQAIVGMDTAEPLAVFQALGRCYVQFAVTERQAWAALFEFTPRQKEGLEGHREALQLLVARIVATLVRLRPDMEVAQAEVRARTLFSAVHGVVHMALEGWFLGAPRERLDSEVEALITAMVRGLGRVD